MRLYNDKEGFQMSLKTLNWQVTKISSLLSGVNLYELNVKTKNDENINQIFLKLKKITYF